MNSKIFWIADLPGTLSEFPYSSYLQYAKIRRPELFTSLSVSASIAANFYVPNFRLWWWRQQSAEIRTCAFPFGGVHRPTFLRQAAARSPRPLVGFRSVRSIAKSRAAQRLPFPDYYRVRRGPCFVSDAWFELVWHVIVASMTAVRRRCFDGLRLFLGLGVVSCSHLVRGDAIYQRSFLSNWNSSFKKSKDSSIFMDFFKCFWGFHGVDCFSMFFFSKTKTRELQTN